MPIVVLDDTLEHKPLPVPKLVPIDAAYTHAEREVKVKARESFLPDRILVVRDERSVVAVKSTNESLCVDGDTPHHLMNAILYAYNNHCGLRLSPDDLLQCYRAAVCQCVNDHAKKYRSVFVNHSGRKQLIVKTVKGPEGIVWSDEFNAMSRLIDAEVKTKLDLESDFSTSTDVHRAVGSLMKMATFKKYFAYGWELSCGIRAVDLTGTPADWNALRAKVVKCAHTFTSRGNMVNWSKHFIAVIDRLIETLSLPSAGTPSERSKDLEMFWSRIVTYVPHGSGGQKYISGWARVLVPGSEYDEFPEHLNLFDARPPPRRSDGYYEWQSKMKEWAQVCADGNQWASGLTRVEATVDDNGHLYDFLQTVGYLGWVVDANGFAEGRLGYVSHASPPEGTSSARLERSNLGKSYVQRSDAVKKMRQHEDTTEAEGQPRA